MSGNWAGHRECHVLPDWLLIYRIEDNVLVLTLSRTGSHSDLFRKMIFARRMGVFPLYGVFSDAGMARNGI